MPAWVEGPSPEARQAAVRLAEAAAAAHPDNPAIRVALARTLERTGELEGAAKVLRAASDRFPESEPVKASLAAILGRLGEVDEALALAEGAADRGWADSLSLALFVRSGRCGEASRFEAAVAAREPGDPGLAELRLQRLRHDPDAMLRYCEALLADRPRHTPALYHKAIALAQLGEGDAAVDLMGIEAFVADREVATPAGFADRSQFLGLLAEEIRTAPDLRADPAGHATVAGLRTRRFPRPGDRASAALLEAIRAAVEDYSLRLAGDHPFVGARPDQASLTAWGLVFGKDGRQRIHYHPEPWLTGVFYVSAPETEGDGGSIRIGVLPDWAGMDPPWPVLTLKPVPGRLLIFPSFVPHDTLATRAAGERIAVAFDVRPVE